MSDNLETKLKNLKFKSYSVIIPIILLMLSILIAVCNPSNMVLIYLGYVAFLFGIVGCMLFRPLHN
jgi:uncharacterized membrane protein YiaA